MIWSTLKFTFMFCISFFILSVSVKDKTVFDHIYSFTGPIGQELKDTLSKGFTRTTSKIKESTTDLFFSSNDEINKKDKKTKNTQALKNKILKEKRARDQHVREDISPEEAKILSEMINNSL